MLRHRGPGSLKREVGVFQATMLGLGSIVGSGIFVSIGIAAGVTGPSVLLAIVVAALVAACNALSSAQLAANHPVSGGTYEYAYRWLNPRLGFTAGWMFVCAKCSSAATAALGFAGYMLNALGRVDSRLLTPMAFGAVVVLTLLVLSGMRRSSRTNMVIVSVTILSLLFFIVIGWGQAMRDGFTHLSPFFDVASSGVWSRFLEATALMFVAYTGYGRIATLGEEIREPHRNIPRAIVTTLLVSAALYLAVGAVAIAAVGAEALAAATAQQAAPLELAARQSGIPLAATVVASGAVMAMLGVLLNLILGLSRVVLAMARRHDVPSVLATVDRTGNTPYFAVIVVGVIIAGLTLIGNVKTTWSFSAFTVLVYYALTNLAALRLSADERLYPRAISWTGLASCVLLAFFIQPLIWMVGLGLIGTGLVWHRAAQWFLTKAP